MRPGRICERQACGYSLRRESIAPKQACRKPFRAYQLWGSKGKTEAIYCKGSAESSHSRLLSRPDRAPSLLGGSAETISSSKPCLPSLEQVRMSTVSIGGMRVVPSRPGRVKYPGSYSRSL
ncbi:hypothetical protein AG1IA_10321 [Rhizoctonia solani AG-1 IA]|uniref:Uncharacterized protein n=1 Tax=Thanatephorus cucumeris (strain AG1-IA) TaxID=983506 RepID=L8WGY3_THACA|nr:hypothetical protein AG1IA_10321 [Rhizoctonia solani AG-1 IA]